MQKEVGIETDWLPKSKWGEFIPWLNTKNISGVVYEPKGGRADPIRVTEGYINTFKEFGGEVKTNTFCRELIKNSNIVSGVIVDEGPIYADFCLLYTSPSPRDLSTSRMPSCA